MRFPGTETNARPRLSITAALQREYPNAVAIDASVAKGAPISRSGAPTAKSGRCTSCSIERASQAHLIKMTTRCGRRTFPSTNHPSAGQRRWPRRSQPGSGQKSGKRKMNSVEKRPVIVDTAFGGRTAEEESEHLARYFVETEQWRKVCQDEVDIVFAPKGAAKCYPRMLVSRGTAPERAAGATTVCGHFSCRM